MDKELIIDGSYGEGGGQILRTSLTLAAILGRPVRIENIRAGRKNPGLQPQHLTAARAVAKICGGTLIGDRVSSQTLEFLPGPVVPGDYRFDVSEIKASAGSVNLIFQTILLPLALTEKPSRITIKGGTHVPWSPPANYIDDVYLPMLSRMGVLAFYHLRKTGYYPIGSGEIEVEIRPITELKPLSVTTRPKGNVSCVSAVSNLPESIAERQLNEALDCLRKLVPDASGTMEDYDSPGKGTVTFVFFNGGDVKAGFISLGERGKPAEKVAREACDEFMEWWKSGAALDKHIADQLIIPMALTEGESSFTTVEVTLHLLTNIYTIKKFLPVEINVDGIEGSFGTVSVKGCGLP